MDQKTKNRLLTELTYAPQFNDATEVKAYLASRAKRMRRINIGIILIALLVGVTYLAFQDGITVVIIALFLGLSLGALLIHLNKEAAGYLISGEAARELFTDLQENTGTKENLQS